MADGGAETRLMAGGTTLYDLVKLNIEVPARVVDISGLN
jgi:xanthine dehydrogenase YagS FAD-binding subunit